MHKFLKVYTYQEIEKQACEEISARASRLFRVDGMEGHARACDWRLKKYFPDQDRNFEVYSQKLYS